MKQLLIIALLLIVSISARAQQPPPEKKLPVTLNYDQGTSILAYVHKVDSLLSISDLPTNKTLPLLHDGIIVRNIFSIAYKNALKADSLKTVKPSKK